MRFQATWTMRVMPRSSARLTRKPSPHRSVADMDEQSRTAIRKAAEAEAATWPELNDDQLQELRALLSQAAVTRERQVAA